MSYIFLIFKDIVSRVKILVRLANKPEKLGNQSHKECIVIYLILLSLKNFTHISHIVMSSDLFWKQ